MAFDVTFTLQDKYARRTTRRYTNTRALLADCQTDLATMIGMLETLSGCAVVKAEIGIPSTYDTEPDSGANIDAGATLHVRLNNGKLYPMHIPAITSTYLNSDGSVKIDNSDVTDFTGAFATSGGHWTISEGNTVASLESGELDR
jgi:hypothetical protein